MNNDRQAFLARTSGATAYERNGGAYRDANRRARRAFFRLVGFVVVFAALCLMFWAISGCTATSSTTTTGSSRTTAAAAAAPTVPIKGADGLFTLQPDVEYAGAELEYLTNDGGPLGDFAPAGPWRAAPVSGGGYVITGPVTLDGQANPAQLGGVDPVFYIGSWGTMGSTMSNSPTLPLNEAAAQVFNSDKYWQPTAAQQTAITALGAAG